MLRIVLVALALTVASGAVAQHNARYRLVGPTTETGISGANGISIRAFAPFADGILQSLSFWHSAGNVPCQVEAGYWRAPDGFPPAGTGQQQGSRRLSLERYRNEGPLLDCGASTAKRTVTAVFPTGGSGAFLWGHRGAAAIHGIRACRGASGDAIRGVKVFVSTLNANGNGRIERTPSLSDEFQRPACTTWLQQQMCPTNQVATGFNGIYLSDRLIGLQLSCRAVEMTTLNGGPIVQGVTRSRN